MSTESIPNENEHNRNSAGNFRKAYNQCINNGFNFHEYFILFIFILLFFRISPTGSESITTLNKECFSIYEVKVQDLNGRCYGEFYEILK